MLLFIKCTVEPPLFVSTFQYITCYSLSQAPNPFYHLQSWFQYITCYSLSVIGLVTVHTCERFNTSHVTLYPIDPKKLDNTDFSFNTSHVTLYRKQIFTLFCKINRFNTSHVTLYHFHLHSTTSTDFQVSIHHMLLFIRFLDTQYFFFPRFNTSHVTLYQQIAQKLNGIK